MTCIISNSETRFSEKNMKKIIPIVSLIVSFCAFGIAQNPSPTATPSTPDDREVVKITTSLIQLDVTVTDSKGVPVTDLRRDEIEIFENGKRQDISGFSFVDGKPVGSVTVPQPKTNKQAAIVPMPGSQRPEKVRRTIALVVDDLSLSFASAFWVQKAVRKFILEQMQDGDLVAIIRTGAGIGALQQFTTDKNQLLAAADKIKFNLGGSGQIGTFAPITQSLKEELNGVKGTDGKVADYGADIAREQEYEREVNEFRGNIFTYGTLGALNFIIRGMSELPGRKSVVVLSDGIALYTRDSKGNPEASKTYDSIRRLVDYANRASVVFYTLDARGLVAPGAEAGDRITDIFDPATSAKLAARENELRDTQDGLRYIANGTGGLAYINQNDLSKGIEKVLDDQSYYLVAYEPDDGTFDPKTRKFNRVDIKVKRPGVKIRYRSGFFGVSEEQIAKYKPTGSSSLFTALSSPFSANDIQLRFNPVFVAGEKGKLYVRSYLHFDPTNLTFVKQPDGSYNTTFEIAGLSLGDNGIPVDSSAKSFTLKVGPEAYDKMRAKGIVYQFTYEAKKPGPFQYRVAIRDVVSNKVGSANQFVNVPNLKKDRLALSGIIFEDASRMDEDGNVRTSTDSVRDTALRQFRQRANVRYGLNIYNAKLSGGNPASLLMQVKIYRDGAAMYESSPIPVKQGAINEGGSIAASGLIRIGEGMLPGDYVVEVIVTDNNVQGRFASTSQFVAFEVLDQ